MWDVTKVTHEAYQAHRNFYSHIPCGMWLIKAKLYSCSLIFLLTHPVWDVTKYRYWWYRSCVHFYSHIPCGMWLGGKVPVGYRVDFYSHIPCGMWLYFVCTKCVSCNISTHTSRVGCDLVGLDNLTRFLWFLLTHPVWDVTKHNLSISTNIWFLLTHPVWDVTVISLDLS